MGNIRYIAIHNFGGLGQDYRAKTQHLTVQDIDIAHRGRFNMLSTMGYFCGYNFIIEKDGTITQCRAIGEETMANRGHNFDTISIALAGNFTAGVEYPTTEQIESLEILGGALVLKDTQTLFDMNIKFLLGAELDITLDRVLPHRLLQSGTDCYGSGLIDSWGRQIISRAFAKKISLLQEILLQIQDKLKKIKFGKIKGRVPCESTHVIG